LHCPCWCPQAKVFHLKIKELFNGVYLIDGKLATVNLCRGRKVYNEELVLDNGVEYRMWTPYRSKLSAAMLNGIKHMEIKGGSRVLYLGAATGTTVSHVSDIVSNEGSIYAVELSERNVRELIRLCEARRNILPILSDAMETRNYADSIETCDIIYQDISARNQAEIMLANSVFLKKGGYAYFVIKSQSINISKSPKETYKKELKLLEETFELVESTSLEPYDSMHLFAILKKK
jgi:fibrillarin-like pre-rRNA processing protein